MGVLFGIILQGLVTLFSPLIEATTALRISALNFLHYIAFGAFLFNTKNFLNRSKVPPEVREVLAFVDEQLEAGELNPHQAKLYRLEIIRNVIENYPLNKEIRSKANGISIT
jgi:hypothetical protein